MRGQIRKLCHMLGISVALLTVCATLSACAGWDSFEPPVANEIPEGPGALSGEDGEFVILRR